MVDIISFIALILGLIETCINIFLFVKEKYERNEISKSRIIFIVICALVILISLRFLTLEKEETSSEPTATPEPTSTLVPTLTPTPISTPVPTLTPTPTSTPVPTLTPTPTSTPVPTLTPTPTSTPVPTLTPTPTSTPVPTQTPSPKPTIGITICELNTNLLCLQVGEVYDLKCTVLCSDNSIGANIVWMTTDSEIIMLETDNNSPEKGKVTALSEGVATIIVQVTTGDDTKNISCRIKVMAPPSGYTISVSKNKVKLWEFFNITIIPKDESVTEIIACAESPNGNITYGDPYSQHNNITYLLKDVEYGKWKIYAKLKNEAGTYEGVEGEEVVYIELIP